MKKQSEFSEYLLIGFIVQLGLILLMMPIYDISPNEFLVYIREITTTEIVIIVAITYVFGLLALRILSIIQYESLKKVLRWKLLSFLFTKTEKSFVENFNRDGWNQDYGKLMQYGSNASVSKVLTTESHLRIYKSIALLMPVVGIIGFFFGIYFFNLTISVLIMVGGLILSYISFKSHRKSKQFLDMFIKEIIKQIGD